MINNYSKTYEGKRIIVTGSAGFLGSALISRLKRISCTIIRITRQSSILSHFDSPAKIIDIEGDIQNSAVWIKVLKDADYIFHFAAQTSSYDANASPRRDFEANVRPILEMVRCCRNLNIIPTVLFSSTVTVAGIPVQIPVNELHPNNPCTIYDIHKLTAENYLKCFSRLGFIKSIILRLPNVYGPGPNSHKKDRGILNQMIRKAVNGELVSVFGKGDYIRDYIYIEDVADAFLTAGKYIDKLNTHHALIGSGKGHSIAQAASLVCQRAQRATGKKSRIAHIQPTYKLSPIEARNFIANTTYFKTSTRWKAKYSFSEGIDETIRFYLL